MGSASYAAPSTAVYAAPWGSDSAPGSSAAPVRTLARAVALAPASGTVVLRAGSYQEYLVVTKAVTIQNAPGEEVWLDGSSPVTRLGQGRDAVAARRLDHAVRPQPHLHAWRPDSTNADWQFVNPGTAPMAAHPDQVWIDGARRHRRSRWPRSAPGGFYLDEATSTLYVGSDPTGKEVRASVLQQALSVRAPGVVLRGIGIRRYAPSVWHMAAVVLEKPDAVLENVVVSEMATTGISVLARDARLRNVTVEWSGMLGVHNRFADGITYDRVRSSRNNAEHFNSRPVSGGVKIGQTRGVTVTDSAFVDNFGHGFWTDMSVYNTVVRRSDFNRNAGTGSSWRSRPEQSSSTPCSSATSRRHQGQQHQQRQDLEQHDRRQRPLALARPGQPPQHQPLRPGRRPARPFPDPEMPWSCRTSR